MAWVSIMIGVAVSIVLLLSGAFDARAKKYDA